jgi:phosphoesterase RecJ-like protein
VSQTNQQVHEMQLEAAKQAVYDAETILVVSHVNPDGDAVGSLLGLANAFRQMGKQVTTAIDDGVPAYLQFLPHAEDVYPSLQDENMHWDLMVSTDASDEERTGEVGQVGRRRSTKVLNLDHHITNTFFGDIHLVSSNAVSAAEVAFTWLSDMGTIFDETVAIPLLTGMVTDTLGFRTNNVNARTFEVLQRLMATGIQLYPIIHRTLGTMTMPEFKLWQQVLPRSIVDDKIIYTVITPQDVETAGLDEMTDAGLVSQLNQLDDTHIAVVFKIMSETETQLSLRSKPGYDVAQVAFALGGGGHKQAAGATVQGTFEDVKARVLPLLHDAIAEGSLQIDG